MPSPPTNGIMGIKKITSYLFTIILPLVQFFLIIWFGGTVQNSDFSKTMFSAPTLVQSFLIIWFGGTVQNSDFSKTMFSAPMAHIYLNLE